MNIRSLIKKMILIFGVIGISLTSFAAPKRNNKVVYVKKEPTRRQRAAARARAARRR